MNPASLSELRTTFGDNMQENVHLSGYTAARIGGPADVLVFVHNADELVRAAEKLWKMDMPFTLLGGGSNVLVSERGVRGVVIINRARLFPLYSPKQVSPPMISHSEQPAWGWLVLNGLPPFLEAWVEQSMETPELLVERWPGI